MYIENFYLVEALLFVLFTALLYMIYAWGTANGRLIEIEEAIYKADEKDNILEKITDEETERVLSSAKYQHQAKQRKGK